ncbi:MAG: hypothetical protein AAF304_07155 [Pseudomonadota bacterium]
MNQKEKLTALNKNLDLVAEFYLREMIRREYPEWIDDDGDCQQCDDYYDTLLDAVIVQN